MKLPIILRAGPLCLVVLLQACQKETSVPGPVPNSASLTHATGTVPDDPARVAKIPLIVSNGFLLSGARTMASYDESVAKGGKSKPGDRTPPVVTIISPANGAVVAGSITIQVSASDNVKLASVTLSIDGVATKTLVAAPFNFAWTADGKGHTITATAKDAAGNSAFNTITVAGNTVTADNTPPSVNITSPANGSTVSGTVNIAVTASDNTSVSSVALYLDGNLLTTLSSAPYNFNWDVSGMADGTHTLMASAKDPAGNSGAYSILVTKNTPVTTLPPSTLPSTATLAMPPVQNQGGEGSCVPFATTYAARSAEQYYKTNASSYNYSSNIFSPEFVYNQVKAGDCGSGTGVTTALDFLVASGVCTWQSMPYSSSNGCSLAPSGIQLSEAANYKITSYSRLMVSDVTAIKSMIVNKHPVIITVATDQSFWNAQAGFIWKTYSSTPGISHTIVICGYDDSRHAYKIMNSWGTAWGDSGFSWIDYDFLPQAAFYYGYVIN